MKEKFKGMRLNITFSAVLSIVVGVLFLIYPGQSINAIGKLVAGIVLLTGIVIVITQVSDFGSNIMGVIVGALISMIGLWMFFSPEALLTIIPIAIGVILVVHGIQDMRLAIEGAKASAPRSWIPFVLALINIIFGMICILDAFALVKIQFVIIGIMLIWDGLTDIGIVVKVNHATKGVVDSTIISEEDIY